MKMRQAGVDHQLIAYGHAVHSFTNPDADGSMPGVLYDEKADRRSWNAMCQFLEDTCGGVSAQAGTEGQSTI